MKMAFGSELLVRLRLQSGYLAMGLPLTWHGLCISTAIRVVRVQHTGSWLNPRFAAQ